MEEVEPSHESTVVSPKRPLHRWAMFAGFLLAFSEMMLRLLGCTAEAAADERKKLDDETVAAHGLMQHEREFTNGPPQKRRRRDQTDEDAEVEGEEGENWALAPDSGAFPLVVERRALLLTGGDKPKT